MSDGGSVRILGIAGEHGIDLAAGLIVLTFPDQLGGGRELDRQAGRRRGLDDR